MVYWYFHIVHSHYIHVPVHWYDISLELAVTDKYNGWHLWIKVASPQETEILCSLLFIDMQEAAWLASVALICNRFLDVHTLKAPHPDPRI